MIPRIGVPMCTYQVDAFTDRLFSGNPAAVLILDDRLPDELMLAIAQENNLAETAFVKARPDGAWDLRWFAPAHEVDFCGHATLATAHVLFTEAKADTLLVFHTRVGELRVSREPDGYSLDIPRPTPEVIDALPQEIAGTFREPPVRIFRNFENIFGGGGVINWSFVQNGLVDEVSMVLAPIANGDPKAPRFFTAREPYSSVSPVAFRLSSVKDLGDSIVWLRYTARADSV